MSSEVRYTGMGICDVLTIVFIVLKLLNVITWSWWWVLSPFWISIGLSLLLWIVIILIKSKYDY